MRSLEKHPKTKTSFYIYDDLKAKMAKLVPSGKQTEFVNDSLQEILERMEKGKAKTLALQELDAIKPVKRKGTARQALEKSREERNKSLLKNIKK